MSRRVFAIAGMIVLGTCGGCWRQQVTVMERVEDVTPEPKTVKAVAPPTPVPVQLGEPPRLLEEPR